MGTSRRSSVAVTTRRRDRTLETIMRVVVPACGRGERFKREGYETIKPKIPIAGEPMIDAVVRALSLDASDECVVVTNFDDAMDSDRFGVVRLPRATVGATETVALALEDASLTPNTSRSCWWIATLFIAATSCVSLRRSSLVRRFARRCSVSRNQRKSGGERPSIRTSSLPGTAVEWRASRR